MYYEFTLGDLKDIKDELKEIERELDDQIDELTAYRSDDTNCGSFTEQVNYGMEEKYEDLTELNNKIQEFQDKIEEIIDVIEETEAVENEHQVFIYEPDVLNQKINKLKKLLSLNNVDYKKIFETGAGYEQWEKSTANELDNPDAGLFTDDGLIEETKQADDEKVFRYNREIMQGLNDKLTEVASKSFIENIENLEEIKSKLDKLEILDDIREIAEIVISSGKYGEASGTTTVNGITVQGTGEEMGPSLIDIAHTILDIVGLYPGIVGMIADIINAAIYLYEWAVKGEDTFDDALFSIIGLIPGGKVAIEGISSKGFKKWLQSEHVALNKILKESDGGDFAIDAFLDIFTGLGNDITNAVQGDFGISNTGKGTVGYFSNMAGAIGAALLN